MQAAMDRLWGFLERRRFVVLGAWVVLLLAALPFTVRQTDHLTAGGFGAPGSGSEAVDKALADFEHAQSRALAVVVAQRMATPRPSAARSTAWPPWPRRSITSSCPTARRPPPSAMPASNPR